MPNIYDFTRLYRRRVTGVGVSGSAVRLCLRRIGAKRVRVLTHVTVENTEDNYDLVRLGIKAGALDHYLDELQNPTEDELAVSRSDIILGEGDVFFAELTGTGDDNPLIMCCVGWEIDL